MSSPFKLRIHKWSETVRVNLVTLALMHEVAAMGDRVVELMDWTRKGKVDGALPKRPSASEWVSLYGDHRRCSAVSPTVCPRCAGRGKKSKACWTARER